MLVFLEYLHVEQSHDELIAIAPDLIDDVLRGIICFLVCLICSVLMVMIPIFLFAAFQLVKEAQASEERSSASGASKEERRESFEIFGWEVDRITDLLIEEQDLAKDHGSDALTTTSRILWAGVD
jgi:hypothetical protein